MEFPPRIPPKSLGIPTRNSSPNPDFSGIPSGIFSALTFPCFPFPAEEEPNEEDVLGEEIEVGIFGKNLNFPKDFCGNEATFQPFGEF